jgi:hypothetical protein
LIDVRPSAHTAELKARDADAAVAAAQDEAVGAEQKPPAIYVLKSLVERQAAFLLIQMRQKILNLPSTYARRVLGLTDVNQASAVLREMAISVLNEIKDLPQAAIDPGWLKKLDADEGK